MSAWYVENGQDEIQNELRDRLDNLRSDLGLVGHGFIAFFCRRKLEKQIHQAQKEYWKRANQLGLEARFSPGSHG